MCTISPTVCVLGLVDNQAGGKQDQYPQSCRRHIKPWYKLQAPSDAHRAQRHQSNLFSR